MDLGRVALAMPGGGRMETRPGQRIPEVVPEGTSVLLVYANHAIHKLYDAPSLQVFGARSDEAVRRIEELSFSTVQGALKAARTEPGLTSEGASVVAAVESDAAARALDLGSTDDDALPSSAALAALMLAVLQARLSELVP